MAAEEITRLTKDEVIQLGISASSAQEFFKMLGCENTQLDPIKRAEQSERYERARADMWEAINKHRLALERL